MNRLSDVVWKWILTILAGLLGVVIHHSGNPRGYAQESLISVPASSGTAGHVGESRPNPNSNTPLQTRKANIQTQSMPQSSGEETVCDGFSQLLSLTEFDFPSRDAFAESGRVTVADLPFLRKLLFRLRQTDTEQLNRWTQASPPIQTWQNDSGQHFAELAWITGEVQTMKKMDFYDSQDSASQFSPLFLCQMEIGRERMSAMIVTPHVPKAWITDRKFPQPVALRGLFLKSWRQEAAKQGGPSVVLLTDHIAWLPTDGVPAGQILLAAHGMDVGLFDEVFQRRPFVKRAISRETDAFYASLRAMDHTRSGTVAALAKEQLPLVSTRWRQVLDENKRLLHSNQEKIRHFNNQKNQAEGGAGEGADPLGRWQQASQTAQRKIALATAVLSRASRGLYSVAPLYLEPQFQVGQLTQIEGIARRAIKIAIPEGRFQFTKDWFGVRQNISSSQDPSEVSAETGSSASRISCYYEMEIFTTDSQNLPVVCCVCQLPDRFPLGDNIREPVRVAGIFFKSWLYRTRETMEHKNNDGQNGKQKRLSVPIVIGKRAISRASSTATSDQWPLIAGIVFLVFLAIIWGVQIARARKDRDLRKRMREGRYS